MKYSAQQGFTLIEITMVLFILALLMTSFLEPLASRVEQEERNNTQLQLDNIEAILYGYVLQNNYLPCPDCPTSTWNANCVAVNTADPLDINDGGEDFVAAGGGFTCATETGNLPWGTLGVKGADEWSNNFTYRVDDTFADRSDAITDGTPYSVGPPIVQPNCQNKSATLNVSFSLCSDGEIIIMDAAVAGNTVAINIPAVVVSHGKNGSTVAVSADEIENTNGDLTFVEKDYSATVGAEFDDLLIWISPHIMRTMTVKAGILP